MLCFEHGQEQYDYYYFDLGHLGGNLDDDILPLENKRKEGNLKAKIQHLIAFHSAFSETPLP